MKSAAPMLLLFATIAGCQQAASQQGPPPAPEVVVTRPIVKMVTDYEDFPGRLEASQMIAIRARVTGYLDKAPFKEGAEVKKDDLLFEIDDRPYVADLGRVKANMVQAKAKASRMQADYDRALKLWNDRSIAKEELDKVSGDLKEAKANIDVVEGNVKRAELDVTFTKIKALIDGRVGRQIIDPGNLVKADDTVLTTLVADKTLFAYFDLDERTANRVKRLNAEGKMLWDQKHPLPVFMELADEKNFPRKGYVDFADNRIDADTGTWRLRGVFDNPKRVLSPGSFVRIRLPIGAEYEALMVPEQTLQTDQDQRFAYVVDADNKVVYRQVKVGRMHDGMRVVEGGIQKGEAVIITGIQRVRPGVVVRVKEEKEKKD